MSCALLYNRSIFLENCSMYNSTGEVLGAATAAVVLPATASAITGVNYLYFVAGLAVVLVAYNIVVAGIKKVRASK